RQEFQTEYSTDAFEIHEDAVKNGDKVLIVDDLIATSGTMVAAINLIRRLGGKVIACAVLIELTDLHGREKIESEGCELFSLVSFEGE
ncbi:MAG: phosphoribosyltransferase family protein, partial [Nanoarchaeota archaeon]